MPETVIVFGAHGSGVAEVARELGRLGYTAPEPAAQQRIDDAVLQLIGTPDPGPPNAAPGWEHQPDLEPLRERAAALLGGLDGKRALAGERLSRTFPVWRPVLDGNLRFVICVCPPAETAALAGSPDHPGVSPWDWGESWLDATARALQQAGPDPRLVLFRDEVAGAARLAAFLDAPTPEDSAPAGRGATGAGWRLPAEAQAAYLLLRAAEDARRRPGGLVASEALEDAVADLWHAQRAAAATRAHRDDVRGRLDWTHDQLEQTQQAFAQTEAVLGQATHVMEVAAEEREQLRAALDEARGELARLRGER